MADGRGLGQFLADVLGGGGRRAAGEQKGKLARIDEENRVAQMYGNRADTQRKVTENDELVKLGESLVAAAGGEQVLPRARAEGLAGGVRAGQNINQMTGGLGDLLKQSFIQRADTAGTGGDWGGMNRNLVLAEGKPVALPDVQGDMLIGNRYLPADQQRIAPTSIGQSRIAQNQATAGAALSRAADYSRDVSSRMEDRRIERETGGGAAAAASNLSPATMEFFKVERTDPSTGRVMREVDQAALLQFLQDRQSTGAGTGNINADAQSWVVAQQPQKPIAPHIFDPTDPASMRVNPPSPSAGSADQIKADFRAGRITRESALSQLRQLGY